MPTVRELKAMAKWRGLKRYSKLRQNELLQLTAIDIVRKSS